MIPARYASTRLPGKLLLDFNGKPILQHTYESCLAAEPDSILILTDDHRIKTAVQGFGGDVLMTSESCISGTDRIVEAIRQVDLPDDTIIVNVQGDEPLISPQLIKQVASCLREKNAGMATLAYPITDLAEINNPNVVKTVRTADGFAQSFSRKPIHDEYKGYLRHIGLYAYTAKFLLKMADLPPSPDQLAESLEQLKVLWHGEQICLEIACVAPQQDINTLDDYKKITAS